MLGENTTMQNKDFKFNAKELFDSLSLQEQERINRVIRDNSSKREQARYSRLEKAEIAKQLLVQELDTIEYEIAENDDWFVSKKENNVKVTPGDLNLHRRKAEELYYRKKIIIDHSLKVATLRIEEVVTRIEYDEQKESFYQQRDIASLLNQIYENREREHSENIVSLCNEQEKQRELENARRLKEYESLVAKLHQDKLEKKQNLDAENRKRHVENIKAIVYARKIPYLVHFTPLNNIASILNNGLCSRNTLVNHEFIFTDADRTDGWLDWISVSNSRSLS